MAAAKAQSAVSEATPLGASAAALMADTTWHHGSPKWRPEVRSAMVAHSAGSDPVPLSSAPAQRIGTGLTLGWTSPLGMPH